MFTQKIKLNPVYDSRKSFYNKAFVIMDNLGWTLFSYNTPICRLMPDKTTIIRYWMDSSATTRRHITDFLYQYGEFVMHKKEYDKVSVPWNTTLPCAPRL